MEEPRLKSKSDPSQVPALSAAWPPRKELPDLPGRSWGTQAAGRRLAGTGHGGVRVWPRPWFSDSISPGRKCTALTFTGWKSRGRGPGRAKAPRHKRAGPLIKCSLSGELHSPESSLGAEQPRRDKSLGQTWPLLHKDTGYHPLELLTLSPPTDRTRAQGYSPSYPSPQEKTWDHTFRSGKLQRSVNYARLQAAPKTPREWKPKAQHHRQGPLPSPTKYSLIQVRGWAF